MAFFGVGANPFSTPVGQKIEQATAESLISEDWSLNMEICDLINHLEEGPRDAMKAVRKRLATQPKNYTVVMYTLTVLETCVKNCGKRFHVLACSKDFVQELVKLIGPKNDPPSAVQEKVLSLIQSWAEAFRHQPDLSGVSQVYADLKHKGIEFPAMDAETTAPILTPNRTVEMQTTPAMTSVSPNRRSGGVPPYGRESQSIPATLTAEQTAKLHNELDLVESNAKVLGDMLNELTPGNEHSEDIQLLKDLHATCKVMQERVVELVGRISDDNLTADLLKINDDLNNLFVRYERHMAKVKALSTNATATKAGSPPESPQRPPSAGQPAPPKKEAEDAPLIDLGEDSTPPVAQMANLNIKKKNEDADFDVFAQSRTATEGSKPSEASLVDGMNDLDSKPSDFDEMEEWLSQQAKSSSGEGATPQAARVAEETISSSDFERFLAERAAAADTLPTIPAATGSSGAPPPHSRAFVKEDKADSEQFAL